MSTMQTLIDKLANKRDLADAELLELITSTDEATNQLLAAAADKIRQQYYGKGIYKHYSIDWRHSAGGIKKL